MPVFKYAYDAGCNYAFLKLGINSPAEVMPRGWTPPVGAINTTGVPVAMPGYAARAATTSTPPGALPQQPLRLPSGAPPPPPTMAPGAIGPTAGQTAFRGGVGGLLGGIGGYYLSPEDRKGQGTVLGGALTGLGAAVAPHFGVKGIPQGLASLLGGAAGFGLSQAMINKNKPDLSEDPYQYYGGQQIPTR